MLTSSDLDAMKSVQEAHMMDRCLIYQRITESDSAGAVRKDFVDPPVESICGLEMIDHTRQTGNQFSSGGHYETVSADAKLRLPCDVVINPKDEVVITQRFGVELVAPLLRFTVVGIPLAGPSGKRVFLEAKSR